MRLVDQGFVYKTIMDGRKIAGRVVKHASEPCYLGIIGKLTVRAATEREAFEEVVAQHWGYPNAAALRARNAQIRHVRKQQRAHARYIVNEMLHHNFKPLDALFGIKPKE